MALSKVLFQLTGEIIIILDLFYLQPFIGPNYGAKQIRHWTIFVCPNDCTWNGAGTFC